MTEVAHIDPICGMRVAAEKAAGSVEHKGKRYYFCSKACAHKFTTEPERWLNAKPDVGPMQQPAQLVALTPTKLSIAGASAPAGTFYICPMDPEVRQDRPGPCPICGMALEPEIPAAGPLSEDSELRNMTRRFWLSMVLTIPLVFSS